MEYENGINRDKALEVINIRMKANIEESKDIFEVACQFELTNEQSYLDWQDELNKISIAFRDTNINDVK